MTADKTTKDKALKELRALAKARGLTGYSKLTKPQLLRRLGKPAAESAAADRSTKKSRARKTPVSSPNKGKQAQRPAPPKVAAKPKPSAPRDDAPPHSTPVVRVAATEEWVESAKYALRPNGRVALDSAADLDEDIDRLPVLSEPVVCLLPQKPGVLHAYWVLPPGEIGTGTDYKLRLGRSINGTVQVVEEIPLPANRGNWYFNVPEQAGAFGLLVELGYYRDGKFIAARGRSVARLPSLYASERTDERWWVSEAEFRRMYLNAGGFVAGTEAYGFVGAGSSPIGLARRSG